MTTNTEQAESVNRLNDTLKIYNELRNPELVKHRENFAQQTEKDMETLFAGFENFVEGLNNGN